MKIRQGFVSNSSSSSFCILGTRMSISKVFSILTDKNPERKEELNELLDAEGSYAVEEVINEIMEELSEIDSRFEYYTYFEGDSVYIGISPMDIQDDETGAELKGIVIKGLQEVLNCDDTPQMILEEIYKVL